MSWTSWLRPPENATPSAFQPGTVLTALRDPCTWARLMPHPGSRLDTDLQPQWSSPAVVTVKPGQSEPRGGAGGRQSGGAQAAGGRGGAAGGGVRGMRGRVVGSKARARLPAPQAQPHGHTGFSTTDSGAPTPPPGPSALTSPQGTMRFIWSPTPERPVMSLWLRQLKRRPFRSRREPWRWPPGRPGAAAPVQDLRSHPRTPLNRGRRGRDTGVGWMCPGNKPGSGAGSAAGTGTQQEARTLGHCGELPQLQKERDPRRPRGSCSQSSVWGRQARAAREPRRSKRQPLRPRGRRPSAGKVCMEWREAHAEPRRGGVCVCVCVWESARRPRGRDQTQWEVNGLFPSEKPRTSGPI